MTTILFETGALLTAIFLIGILIYRRHIGSGIIYFGLLMFMSVPSLIKREYLIGYIHRTPELPITAVLGILLVLGFLPWYIFNRYIDKHNQDSLQITPRYLKRLKKCLVLLIIGSLFSIIYQLPYAVYNMAQGAVDVRQGNINNGGGIIEATFATTVAVGLAALNIYCILFYFLSLILPELKRFNIWLLLCSFSNIIGSLVFAGRDQLIVFISFFIVFYMLFAPFLKHRTKHILKRSIIIICGGILLITLSITRDRFDHKGSTMEQGTIGYIAEQPYVFNSQVIADKQMPIDRRFPILNTLFDNPQKWNPKSMVYAFEWQFGTMYGEFYSFGPGWWSLFIFSFIFIGYYSIGMKRLSQERNLLGLLMMFTVYLYICITGLFYVKAGGSMLTNLFYIALSIIPFYLNRWIRFVPGNVDDVKLKNCNVS